MSEQVASTLNMKTAEQRGIEMMTVPMGEIPQVARDYAKLLCDRMGMCGEVLLTAWCHFAECCGLPRDDDPAYHATPEARDFFADKISADECKFVAGFVRRSDNKGIWTRPEILAEEKKYGRSYSCASCGFVCRTHQCPNFCGGCGTDWKVK